MHFGGREKLSRLFRMACGCAAIGIGVTGSSQATRDEARHQKPEPMPGESNMNIDPDMAQLSIRATMILHEILTRDRTWVGIHAAEALAGAGETAYIHEKLRTQAARGDNPLPRIGIWRVLASTATNQQERADWIQRIEQVFLDPQAPDRKQAIESLAKLGHRVSGPVLEAARRMAGEPPEMNTILPVWCLHNSGDSGMLKRLEQALSSSEPVSRQRAAYALRWIGANEPTLLAALSQAAHTEVKGTLPRVFLLSAAFALDADPARRPAWRSELETALHTGPVAASFEAGQALATCTQAHDLRGLAGLLDHPEDDTRVAAANIILLASARRKTSHRFPHGLVK